MPNNMPSHQGRHVEDPESDDDLLDELSAGAAWQSEDLTTFPYRPTGSEEVLFRPRATTPAPQLSTSPGSDFEIIDESDALPQADGFAELYNRDPARQLYQGQLGVRGQSIHRNRSQRQQEDRQDWRAFSSAGRMEAGNSNDYNSPQWQQAGHNADAQDLAGPGAHGRLECTVTKPQKEGEGTQNPYISYLVSTDVSRNPRAIHPLVHTDNA